ncbi:MAG: hypothetical protein Q4F70_00385 [Clostridia bacterium]|nr:hypothetical protein [Clostridia bacterium]
MKRVIALLLSLSFTLLLFGCSKIPEKPSFEEAGKIEINEVTTKQPEKDKVINIAGLKGPTAIGMSYLFKSIDEGKALNNYKYTIESDVSVVSQKLLSGEIDIAALPTNVAASLYNKNPGKIQMISLATVGALYLVEAGSGSESIAKLDGQKVYVGERGTASEYALKYLLAKAGVEANISYDFDSNEDLAAIAEKGRIMHGVLIEPYATLSTPDGGKEKVTLDLSKEWEKAVAGTDDEGSEICGYCLVANSDFLASYSKAVSNFIREYKASVSNVRSQTTAADIVAGYGLIESADAAKEVLSKCGIVCVSGNEMQEKATKYLTALFGCNKDFVGGAIPDDGFYYVK